MCSCTSICYQAKGEMPLASNTIYGKTAIVWPILPCHFGSRKRHTCTRVLPLSGRICAAIQQPCFEKSAQRPPACAIHCDMCTPTWAHKCTSYVKMTPNKDAKNTRNKRSCLQALRSTTYEGRQDRGTFTAHGRQHACVECMRHNRE